ncbi:MAG: hypothetical protein WCI60_05100, partial [bacterium]
MYNIKTLSDINIYLDKLRNVQLDHEYKLKRMRDLMSFLGNPQKNLNIIHVAGTSGKTSTCYYVVSLLKQAGYTTGLSVSPHIDEINERLQINLNPLKISEFIDVFNDFCKIIETFDQNITYFEFFIA